MRGRGMRNTALARKRRMVSLMCMYTKNSVHETRTSQRRRGSLERQTRKGRGYTDLSRNFRTLVRVRTSYRFAWKETAWRLFLSTLDILHREGRFHVLHGDQVDEDFPLEDPTRVFSRTWDS